MSETAFSYSLNKAFSEELESRSAQLAAELVDEQYRLDPSLEKRWGQRGRDKSLEDALHNLSFLAEALALGDKQVFTKYILWLAKVLAGAGVPVKVLSEHLNLLAAKMPAVLTPACAAAAAPFVEAALAALKAPEAAL